MLNKGPYVMEAVHVLDDINAQCRRDGREIRDMVVRTGMVSRREV